MRAIHSCMAEATAPSDTFNWALVKSFVAVLDAGSLMGAARKLKAQQPTLSRHIAELEAQLGAPLFERTGRGVMPTVAALAIADAARQMEDGRRHAAAHAGAKRAGHHRHACASPPARWRRATCCRRCWPRCSRPNRASRSSWWRATRSSNLLRREADIAVRMVRPAQAVAGGQEAGRHPDRGLRAQELPQARRHAACAHRPAAAAAPADRLRQRHRHRARLRADGRADHARALCAAHRRPARLRPADRRRRRHRLCGRLQPAPLARRGAHPARAGDPAAAVLAGGAPRDPRQRAWCAGSTTFWPRRSRASCSPLHDGRTVAHTTGGRTCPTSSSG